MQSKSSLFIFVRKTGDVRVLKLKDIKRDLLDLSCDRAPAPIEKALPVIKALANKTRQLIIDLLLSTERSVDSISFQLALPQAVVSQHLKILARSELVRCHQQGRQRIYGVHRKHALLIGLIFELMSEKGNG